FTLTYNVSDMAGNAAVAVTRTVNVTDQTAPVITLVGANPLVVAVGGTFTDPGATAVDNVDGDRTGQIVVSGGPVVTTAPGTFTLTYNVSDMVGNAAVPVTRTVNVIAVVAPVLQFECLRNPTEDTRISFQTVNGLRYTLHTSTDLVDWTPLDTVNGDGLWIDLIHTGGGSGPQRFYEGGAYGPQRFYKVTVTIAGP
ncbi:MAG: DUF5011 domain-containing protein, partial [Chthoniobacteraceae bacterium]